MDSWSPVSLRTGGLFLPLRDRALFAILAPVGPRVTALSNILRGHYERDHQRPDGRRGPAIRLTPGKTKKGRVARYKPITEGQAEALDSYLHYIGLMLGRPVRDDEPLFHATQTDPSRKLSSTAIRGRLRGDGKVARAMIPRHPDNPCDGYSPHTIRAAAAQMILSFEAQAWLQAERIDPHPISIAEALLDHDDMKLDEFGYHGASKPQDRERLSAIGAELNWLMLTTDLGARKQRDGEAFRALLQRRKALWVERQRFGDIKRSCRRKAASRAAGGDLEAVIFANVEADQAADHEAEVVMQLGEIEGELNELRLSPERLVCVPDDVSDDEVDKVDFAEIEREVNGGVVSARARRLERKRLWITSSEYAEAGIGPPESTVRRWISDGVPPGVRPHPWKDPDAPPILIFSNRRRAIHVDGINPDTIDTPEKAEKLAEILAADPPDRWTSFPLKPELPRRGARGEGPREAA